MVFGLVYFLPWERVDWGKVAVKPAETVTVTGEAKSREKNQMARFNAGVEVVGDSKEKAVAEVNDKVAKLIESVKSFGIESGDIQTQNMSIYQSEESYWDNGVQKSRKGQWRVSNSVEVILREVERASDLANLLSNSGATNVFGPSFSFDDVSAAKKELYEAAMDDARDRAEILARAAGRKLGKVLSVTEGGSVNAIYSARGDYGGMGGGAPMEPGSGEVTQSLNVIFELK